MMHLQPQPAGLPLGSFGARRRGGATHRHADRPWLAAAHRPPLLAAAALLFLAALQAGLGLLARTMGWPLGWAVSADLAMALPLTLGACPMLLLGLMFGAMPDLLAFVSVPGRWLAVPVRLFVAGWALALVGFQGSRMLAGLGLAMAAVGMALATGLFGLLVIEARARRAKLPASRLTDADAAAANGAPSLAPAAWALLAAAVCTVALWASGLGLVLGRTGLASAVLAVAAWAGPGLGAVALGLALLPAVAAGAAGDAWRAWRGRLLPNVLAVLVLAQAVLAGWDALAAAPAPTALCALMAAVNLGMGAALLWLSLRWGLRSSLWRPLLALVHLAWAWLGVAITLAGLSLALRAVSGGSVALGAVPEVAMSGGFAGLLLLALASWQLQTVEGLAPRSRQWLRLALTVAHAAVAWRLAAELWPVVSTPMSLLSAQFSLAAALAWAVVVVRGLLWPQAAPLRAD